MEAFKLQKRIWRDSDFADMGWHDATLWSITADPERFEFLADLDYILKWVEPAGGETYFRFWVAPVTMVFHNAHTVRVNTDSAQGVLEIADFVRESAGLTSNQQMAQYTYRFDCQEGTISLVATGFSLFVRRMPILTSSQRLELAERGGISFERDSAAA
ncbi:MAG: hypothetical protein WBK08_12410 [Nitrospira sp.]|nr:MAG: hypothetical protein E8D42_10825 [Nitrospira sp.]